jgi:hypothetical protein
MPSGWMPDARHDSRTAFLFDPRHQSAHKPAQTWTAHRPRTRRPTHSMIRRPHAVARG